MHLHKPGVLSYPSRYSDNSYLKSTFASQGPASALPPNQSSVTSHARAQARGLLLPYQLLRHLGHHKHLWKPATRSCPNSYPDTYDITFSASSAILLSLKLACLIILNSLLSLEPRQPKTLFSGRLSPAAPCHKGAVMWHPPSACDLTWPGFGILKSGPVKASWAELAFGITRLLPLLLA